MAALFNRLKAAGAGPTYGVRLRLAIVAAAEPITPSPQGHHIATALHAADFWQAGQLSWPA